MRSDTTGAGDLDWLAVWRRMVDAEHAQSEAVARAPSRPAGDGWNGKARRFAQASDRVAQPDAFMRYVLPHLRATDSVLDVGAGTGRHALFLARYVAHVVAVEPSPAMREQLEQRLTGGLEPRLTVLSSVRLG